MCAIRCKHNFHYNWDKARQDKLLCHQGMFAWSSHSSHTYASTPSPLGGLLPTQRDLSSLAAPEYKNPQNSSSGWYVVVCVDACVCACVFMLKYTWKVAMQLQWVQDANEHNLSWQGHTCSAVHLLVKSMISFSIDFILTSYTRESRGQNCFSVKGQMCSARKCSYAYDMQT